MAAALFALLALYTCARSDTFEYSETSPTGRYSEARTIDQTSLLSGCLYEGRWHASGAVVVTREKCLHCVCVRSTLSCRRRACSQLSELPPKRCHIRHRRDACCPELVCPDGVISTEENTKTRFEREDLESVIATAVGQACVEGGTVYAAGSAMSTNVACEQCFCLQGTRKCVRPKCLPPPPHCVPRPTSGACCPQRYYCEHDTDVVKVHTLDCDIGGKRVQEGEQVSSGIECTTCFCLKGEVQCQELGCAPPIQGCQPILRPGDCCARQYKCEHNTLYRGTLHHQHAASYNSLTVTRNEDRALHMQKYSKSAETSTNKAISSMDTSNNMPIASATTDDLDYTVKVKRKTDETLNEKLSNDNDAATSYKMVTMAIDPMDKTESVTEENTEIPEDLLRIFVNGTINCTSELSSTSLPLGIAFNDTDKNSINILPRVPIVNGIEAQAYSANDVITDRAVFGDFDEIDTFTINVTSSLNANTNSTSRPIRTSTSKKPFPVDLVNTVNSSKKSEDFEYDYMEPTLPPSLPNLKIIPFVAADAVVDDDLAKETQRFSTLDRGDKYPVYYPANAKESSLIRRDESYQSKKYPVFVLDNEDLSNDRIHAGNNKYAVSTSLANHMNEEQAVTKPSATSSTYKIETPGYNLFSPPIETEGGFIPKDPGIDNQYYAVYSSTPSGAPVPHLTTSMQLDIQKGDCLTEDGQRVPEGENITVDCNVCVCEWGRLKCAPPLCRAPPRCHFSEPGPDSANQCCGDLVCKKENKTATALPVTESVKVNKTHSKVQNETRNISPRPSQLNTTLHELPLTANNNTINTQTQDKSNKKYTNTPHTRSTPPTVSTIKAKNTNGAVASTTASPEPKPVTTTTIEPPANSPEVNDTSSEYEDEEDVGFSFGSVLKLLLSENYDSTTPTPQRKVTPTKPPMKPTPPVTSSTRRPPPTVNPFIPLPSLPFTPPKIVPPTVNRIDHLVLGEATAIKRTTLRPITTKQTKKPTERSTERSNLDIASTPGLRPPSISGPTGSNSLGIGAGLLKLAGCNIYGRIYRVGRIIAELSTPCLECWCVEVGVECKKLAC